MKLSLLYECMSTGAIAIGVGAPHFGAGGFVNVKKKKRKKKSENK